MTKITHVMVPTNKRVMFKREGQPQRTSKTYQRKETGKRCVLVLGGLPYLFSYDSNIYLVGITMKSAFV